MSTKILKNTTGSPVDVTDMGITLGASSSYTIPPVEYALWQGSSSIVSLINAGTVVVNDGTSDLSAANGLIYLQELSATHLGNVQIDLTGIGDQKKIIYDSASNKLKFNADSPGSASGGKGDVQFRGNTAGTFSSQSQFNFDTADNSLSIGPSKKALKNNPLGLSGNVNDWTQYNITNQNTGNAASADVVLTSDVGGENSGFVDLGVNNSGYNQSAYNSGGPGDGYLMMNGGDFAFVTETNNDFAFFLNGATNTAEKFRLTKEGNIIVGRAALATNATNGFLYIASCAGTPTGTPTSYSGRTPLIFDTTNNKLYAYMNSQWRDLTASGGSGGYYQNITLSDQSNAALTTTSGSYTVMSRCVFPGSATVTMTKVFASCSVAGSSANMDLRIYDLTNSQVICEKLAFGTTSPVAYDIGTLSNIPSSVAVFEVQMRANGGSGKTAKCSGVLLGS